MSIIIIIIFIVVLSVVWSINYKELLIFASTFLTVCGVALFATWSILSNPLSSVIIFFFSSYKIEDTIKVLDGENTVSGKIIDMNLFVVLSTELCRFIVFLRDSFLLMLRTRIELSLPSISRTLFFIVNIVFKDYFPSLF